MATVNIKQNNINFTVDDVNTPKSWNPMAGSTFAPADLGTDFNINMLKTAEDEGWLNDLRILHGLFIDWDGAQITLNGRTYTIHNTGELFSAIKNANKTYPLGDYQGKLKSRAFYIKYNKLLSRINKLIDDKISYIEPEYPPVEYSFWIDNTKVYDNTLIYLGETITIPAPNVYELGDDVELFEGWKCELDGNLYKPGDQYTLTQEDYDKVVGEVFTFNAKFRDSYLVGINIAHGWYGGHALKRIKTGEQASWKVYANEGYKLPTSVTNGTINGNIVTSDIVTKNFTVDVVCEEDISNTEPGSPDPE